MLFRSDTAGIELIPVVQCLGNLSVELPEPKTAEACLRRVDELSEIIRDDGMLAAKWREFAEENREWYHKMFLFPTLADRILRKLGFSQNLKARKRGIAGMVRCESLRDLMLESFSEE